MGKAISFLKLYTKMFIKAIRCICERLSNLGSAYLVLTPEHGNLGDHAIAKAEKRIMEDARIRFVEITITELQKRRELGLLRLMNGRSIFVNGGGNLGTLWPRVEWLIRSVIQQNPRSNIVIFPSTIFYDETDSGEAEKQQSVEIYSAHKKLYIYLREKQSFDIAAGLYKTNSVNLMPDMAMLLNESEPHLPRHGCILTLRSDCEKTRSADQDAAILKQVREVFGDDYSYLDMNVGHAIPIDQRDSELDAQFDSFRRAELVITDRLHGMIFSAITGTPCIVIESKSHKVRGCYEWIRNLEYIRFCDNVEDIAQLYGAIPKKQFKYDNSRLTSYFDSLADEIVERR